MSVHPIDLAKGLSVHSSQMDSVEPGLLDRDHSQSCAQLAVEARHLLLLDTSTARLQLPPIVFDFGTDPLRADSRTGPIQPSSWHSAQICRLLCRLDVLRESRFHHSLVAA